MEKLYPEDAPSAANLQDSDAFKVTAKSNMIIVKWGRDLCHPHILDESLKTLLSRWMTRSMECAQHYSYEGTCGIEGDGDGPHTQLGVAVLKP
jgi:hypothetical protein